MNKFNKITQTLETIGQNQLPESVIKHTIADILAIQESILEQNKNRKSDYDLNNFQSDFDRIFDLLLSQLKNPFEQFSGAFKVLYYRDEKLFNINLGQIPESDFYVSFNLDHLDLSDKDAFVDKKLIADQKIMKVNVIENSFTDLFLKNCPEYFSPYISSYIYLSDNELELIINPDLKIEYKLGTVKDSNLDSVPV
jgi:hypothetical protein